METILDVKLQNYTPDDAEEVLTNHNYQKQRKIRSWHSAILSDEILKGRFIQGTQIHFVHYEGKKHLVNGQHTLDAIRRSGASVQLSVLNTKVDTAQELASIYYRHDIHLTRSMSDAMHAAGMDEETGLTATQVGELGSAVRFMATVITREHFVTKNRIARDDIMDYTREWAPTAKQFYNTISGSNDLNQKLIRKSAVMSVALVNFKYSLKDDKAVQFWWQVVNDDCLSNTDPRKTLLRFLTETRITGGGVYASKKAVVTNAHTARAVAAAWNAFYDDRQLSQIRIHDKSQNILIKGSPYNK